MKIIQNTNYPVVIFLVSFVENTTIKLSQYTILSNFPKFPKCSRKFLNKQCHKYDYELKFNFFTENKTSDQIQAKEMQ